MMYFQSWNTKKERDRIHLCKYHEYRQSKCIYLFKLSLIHRNDSSSNTIASVACDGPFDSVIGDQCYIITSIDSMMNQNIAELLNLTIEVTIVDPIETFCTIIWNFHRSKNILLFVEDATFLLHLYESGEIFDEFIRWTTVQVKFWSDNTTSWMLEYGDISRLYKIREWRGIPAWKKKKCAAELDSLEEIKVPVLDAEELTSLRHLLKHTNKQPLLVIKIYVHRFSSAVPPVWWATDHYSTTN